MTTDNCIKYPFCVEWTTGLPYAGVYRSSYIFLGGFGLQFELSYLDEQYTLRMFLQNKESTVRKLIILSTNTYCIYTFHFDLNLLHHEGYCNFSEGKDLVRGYWTTFWTKRRNELSYNIDHLAIMCAFHSTDTQNHVSIQTTLNKDSANLQILSRDFSTFLKDKTFSDVKLQCADITFSAHRSVLAARSEVFAAMFRNKMAESTSNMVHIKNVDSEVLELLLEYMYSAKFPDLCEETARQLYKAADQYAVCGLRRVCSDWMVERQTKDNCLDLLVLADEHSDAEFKDAVACFVAEHLADLSVQYWSTFNDLYPLLVLSVLKKRCEDSMPGAAKRPKH